MHFINHPIKHISNNHQCIMCLDGRMELYSRPIGADKSWQLQESASLNYNFIDLCREIKLRL